MEWGVVIGLVGGMLGIGATVILAVWKVTTDLKSEVARLGQAVEGLTHLLENQRQDSATHNARIWEQIQQLTERIHNLELWRAAQERAA